MMKLKKCFSVAAGCTFLLLAFALSNEGRTAAQQRKDIKDTPASSTPKPAVAQDSSKKAGFACGNKARLCLHDADKPVNQPFQAEASFRIANGSTSTTFSLAAVPAGTRLVIEHVTVIAEVPAGQKMGASISTTAGGKLVAHQLVLTEQGPLWGVPAFAASQPVRLYADQRTDVLGIVLRTDTLFRGDGRMSISGHLVDVP